jgi:hypothetical protein
MMRVEALKREALKRSIMGAPLDHGAPVSARLVGSACFQTRQTRNQRPASALQRFNPFNDFEF